MNLGENIGNSFEYTKKLAADAKRLVLLIVFSIIPILNFITLGYFSQVMRESPEGSAPPELKNLGGLLVQGLMVFIVAILWVIIPVAIIGAGFWQMWYAYYMVFGFPGWLIVGAGRVLLPIFCLLMFVGLANMIKQGSIAKAFAVGELVSIIKRIGVVSYIVWVVVMYIIIVVVGGIAAMVPVVGWLISMVITPFIGVFAFRSSALVYASGKGYAAPAQGAAMPPPPPPTIAGKVFCPQCGTENAAGARFCVKCGKEIRG